MTSIHRRNSAEDSTIGFVSLHNDIVEAKISRVFASVTFYWLDWRLQIYNKGSTIYLSQQTQMRPQRVFNDEWPKWIGIMKSLITILAEEGICQIICLRIRYGEMVLKTIHTCVTSAGQRRIFNTKPDASDVQSWQEGLVIISKIYPPRIQWTWQTTYEVA